MGGPTVADLMQAPQRHHDPFAVSINDCRAETKQTRDKPSSLPFGVWMLSFTVY